MKNKLTYFGYTMFAFMLILIVLDELFKFESIYLDGLKGLSGLTGVIALINAKRNAAEESK